MFLLTRVTRVQYVPGTQGRRWRRAGAALAALALGVTLLVPAAARAERTVTIRGGGFGHGIGMSQYGAYGRALKGRTSTEILEHYYSGARSTKKEMPNAFRVGLLPGYGASMTSATFTSKGLGDSDGTVALAVAGDDTRVARGDESTTFRIETAATGGVKIYKNGTPFKKDGRTVFGDASHPLIVKFAKFNSLLHLTQKNIDYKYGVMEFGAFPCGNGRCLRVVLSVPMEKYIYGLGEVPASWPAAALEAQAIAGRTYAYSKFLRTGQHREPCDCAVYDSTIDQAYIGDAKRTGSGKYWADWKGAVDATAGKVMISGGEPIQALYSSSSGGHTENNENVWGGAPISYLRGVQDGPDYAGGANPNFKWELTMSWAEFESKLNAAYGIGTLSSFELVRPYGVSGRVTVVKSETAGGARITGSQKVVRESGWSLRSALGLKDSLFRVEVAYDVAERFKPRWNELNGAPGDATSKLYRVPKRSKDPQGRAQDFEKGRMTYVAATDTVVWQWGKVLRKYETKRREKGPLGMPRSGIWGPGRYLGGTYLRGRILWSKDTGPHAIIGRFDEAFARVGGLKSALGLPLSDRERARSLPDGGRRQRFTGGRLYLDPRSDKVFAVWGAVAAKYRKIGEAKSPCGYPTDDLHEVDGHLELALKGGQIKFVDGAVKVLCS
jgi:SpoIID/LytB domain protein